MPSATYPSPIGSPTDSPDEAGKKDRMVPIGERAIGWIRKYVDEARGQLAVPPDEGVLFLTQEGEAISPERLTQLVREYVLAAETARAARATCFATPARP
jgi:integrase/recombinase XerD